MTGIGGQPEPAPGGSLDDHPFSADELEIALRNREMPLEALGEPITPTGLHYLLAHFDIPFLDPTTWQLSVGGLVERPFTLSLRDLEGSDTHTVDVTMECAGNGRSFMSPRHEGQPWRWGGVSTATWGGVRLAALLERAGIASTAREIVCIGADEGVEDGATQRYARSLPIDEALQSDVLVATSMNGVPLPPQHGAPARLVVPGWYGMASVKWLTTISAVSEPFDGPQQWSYELRSDEEIPGTPISRMQPRALMAPPGFAGDDGRILRAGQTELVGRAWSGAGPVTRVEVSTDGGASWMDATLGPPPSTWAWRGWHANVRLGAGHHVLRCRATDARGARQPDEAPWNVWGYLNNAPQHVEVSVSAREPGA